MKKLLVFIIIILISVSAVYAQSSTDSASSNTKDDNLDKVEDLKERLATKVAQLQQKQRQAIFGVVKSTSITQITVETKTKEVIIELTDDIKVFQIIRAKRTKLTIEDVDEDDEVVVFGEYDSTLDVLKANIVFIQGARPIRVSGTVDEINSEEYTISISDITENKYVVDYEKTTIAKDYFVDKGIQKGGFSKFSVGEYVSVLATPDVKDEFRLSAHRILRINNQTSSSSANILE
ncbi:hypothetical protein ACFL1A_00625 [Patescibacteria group bacterium]